MKLTFKIWLLIVIVLLSLISIFSIPPLFLEKGVLVKSVQKDSLIFNLSLRQGEIITSINGHPIVNLADYQSAMEIFSDNQPHKLDIVTKKGRYIELFSPDFVNQIVVSELPKNKILTGLDIQGGARALVTAENHQLTDSELSDLIEISKERLNVYGLTDLSIREASDLQGNKYMVVEIAGSTPSDLESLIAQQGKFEAKIGNETVFVGGKKDITYVARTGQESGVTSCDPYSGGYVCRFQFAVHLSTEAAKRHASITSTLGINSTAGNYLDKTLDLYVDDQLVDSLLISEDLKGKETTAISVSGSGSGATQDEAFKSAQSSMKKLQTIMITGSLAFKLQIVKTDIISPVLGQEFTKSILFGGLLAILAVSLIIFIRYRKINVSLALLLTSFSELIIILGIASLIRWNLDLPSIAGIIATIGTGVDSQIVILDESRNKIDSISERIKKALFIILTAFGTTAVSLLPLTGVLGFIGIGAVGAGLLRGFAVTTLIGITAGVFITRPAFADIIKKVQN